MRTIVDHNTNVTEFVAIAHPGLYRPQKRHALYFDRIGMIGLDETPSGSRPEVRAEFEWLVEHGLVFRTGLHLPDRQRQYSVEERALVEDTLVQAVAATVFRTIAGDPHRRHEFESRDALREQIGDLTAAIAAGGLDRIAEKAQEIVGRELRNRADDIVEVATASTAHSLERATRLIALQHRKIEGSDTIPLIATSPAEQNVELGSARGEVLQVVLRALPEPDQSTSWDDILEFRANEDAQRDLRRLRLWVNALAGSNRSPRDVTDELNDLYDRFTEHMRLHKMKINHGVFETFVTVTADVTENLMKLRLGNAARVLFSISQRRIAMMEAELQAPGREVAYIARAVTKFGGA